MAKIIQRFINGMALGLAVTGAVTLAGDLFPGPSFAQSMTESQANQNATRLVRQIITDAIYNNKLVASASQAVQRANLAAGMLLRVHIPRILKRIKSRFVHPDGSIDWGRVVVLLVVLYLLWRMW